MLRLVTYFPSFPAKGELLTRKVMVSVGGSISTGAMGVGFSTSHTLSPISMPSMPTMATMSPAAASGTSTRPKPSKLCTCSTRAGRSPERPMSLMAWPDFTRPP